MEFRRKVVVEEEEGEVLIREYIESRDRKLLCELEKNCEIFNNSGLRPKKSETNAEGVSTISTNMITDDPLCRIRLYTLRIMLVAELKGSGEVVGVVKGCIKNVYLRKTSAANTTAGSGRLSIKLGCVLGLRISPAHRRKGIGSKLMKSLEDWMAANGAEYALLATEETNTAAMNLFIARCNYLVLSSLIIYIFPTSSVPKEIPDNIRTEKLLVDQAISFYKKRLKSKDVYPADISMILKEKPSLGTWISYFRRGNADKVKQNYSLDITEEDPGSWVIFSVWNTSEAYKLQIKKPDEFKFFNSALGRARKIILPCLKLPTQSSVQEPFGFIFLYGLFGEGERVRELVESMWEFAARLAISLKDCGIVMTELGSADPLMDHISISSSITCINDVWCVKKLVKAPTHGDDRSEDLMGKREPEASNVFIDPRDF